MRRRELLATLGVGVVVPYNAATSKRRESERPLIDETVVSVLDDTVEQTGRLYRAYRVEHGKKAYEKWVMESSDGDVLYQDHYLADKLETYWDGIQLRLTYHSTSAKNERRGETLLSLSEDHVYQTHYRDPPITYREHIDSGDREYIE